ncbi:chloride channel protein [Rhizobium sp. LC145]|jgi:chloride channel protein, CIC family|uniref:chloride channel protein n=1 Tax=Rhizobium sp. LC145 TaxID=1120688 RepID=UPI00062A1A1E|nr:chloride channel protein [Rhizobium sp. LC145]KKX24491.1 chloride channel protein [Rhizobium sp. LC145]TKT46571.1 chloride channel protein [Rhizobiaceae bacterium LC148]
MHSATISTFLHAIRVRFKLFKKKALARGSEIGLIACAALVGVASGCVVSGMSWISKALHHLIFGISDGEWLSAASIDNQLLVFAAPIAGGIIMGIVFLLLQRRRNRPIVDPIEANALYGGRISLTDSIIVAVQNLVSNGFGASVGLEAGYTQLSSGIASKIGGKLNFRREDLRILVGCGAAGAIAAAFNAPLTGAFYAFELIIGTYSTVALAPVVVAAILATFVARALSGDTFLIEVGEIGLVAPGDFLPAILLGALCAMIGIAIMKGVAFTEQLARKSSIPPALRPALGGIVVGLLAMITPQVLSAGHGALHLNLDTQNSLIALAMIFLLKATASAVSIGSGFRGGLFFASLFMGALLGKIFAFPVDSIMSGSLTPTVYAVVGMSSLAVALIGGPLTMTFLALEITGDFPITALVLAATISSSVVVRTTFGYSFATWRFHLRGESIRSAHDIGWISNLTVDKLMRPDVKKANANLSLQQFREAFPLGSTQRAIIVDDDDRYVGIVLVAEVYGAEVTVQEATLEKFIRYRNEFLQPRMNAKQAAAIFDKTRSDALAVVNNLIERRVIGQLSEAHTLRRYSEELDRRRREAVGEAI